MSTKEKKLRICYNNNNHLFVLTHIITVDIIKLEEYCLPKITIWATKWADIITMEVFVPQRYKLLFTIPSKLFVILSCPYSTRLSPSSRGYMYVFFVQYFQTSMLYCKIRSEVACNNYHYFESLSNILLRL